MPHVAQDRESTQDVSGDEDSLLGSEGYMGRTWTANSSKTLFSNAASPPTISGEDQNRQIGQKASSFSLENKSILKSKRSPSSSANDSLLAAPLESQNMIGNQNSWISNDGLMTRTPPRGPGPGRPVYTSSCSFYHETSSTVEHGDVRVLEGSHNTLSEATSSEQYTGPACLKERSPSISIKASLRHRIRQLSLPRREKHDAPSNVLNTFMKSYEAIQDEGPDPSWLKLSVWWLLKVHPVHNTLGLLSLT